jgi:hypothetical protein
MGISEFKASLFYSEFQDSQGYTRKQNKTKQNKTKQNKTQERREGKGREGKGREGKGREGKGREGKGREGKGGRKGKEEKEKRQETSDPEGDQVRDSILEQAPFVVTHWHWIQRLSIEEK